MKRCLFCENNLIDFIGHRELYNNSKKTHIDYTFFNQKWIYHIEDSNNYTELKRDHIIDIWSTKTDNDWIILSKN